MENYDCRKIEDFKDVWVFCEQRDGKLMSTDFELISEARKLADDLGSQVYALLLGDQITDLARELGGYGADKVLVCESPLLKEYTTDAYTKVICDMVIERKPEIFLLGATSIGRDLGPRCAARLHTGLTADCTNLNVDTAKYLDFLSKNSALSVDPARYDMNAKNLKMTRPAFGGHLMATIVCPRFRPQMSTVRPGVIKKAEFDPQKAEALKIEKITPVLDVSDIHVKVIEVVKTAREMVDLLGAKVVVSVGHGISRDVKKGIALAEDLAKVMGGVVGASRAVVDSGWIGAERQVGQTGKTVRPRIYIALGISGSIQHRAGMQDSECIIAVNNNEAAPIFEAADYGICGDLFAVAPLMIEEAKRIREA
jgi:electron transfer flavoprotein alpha subunit